MRNPLRPLKTAHLMKGTPPAEAMRRSVGHFSHHLDLLRRIEQMERAHGRLPGRRNDPLRRLFRSGLGCRKGKLRLFGNMRITRLESLESRTTQSRAQTINQSSDFNFPATAELQI